MRRSWKDSNMRVKRAYEESNGRDFQEEMFKNSNQKQEFEE